MYEKILEIIFYLVSELQQDKLPGEIDLSMLSERGYTQNEISTALGWVMERIRSEETVEHGKRSPTSIRVLHDSERAAMSTETHGYLLQLRELGILSDLEFEKVVDRIMLAGFPTIGLDEVKTLVASIVFDPHDSDRPGSRLVLNTKDTIH